jgi:glyoxylase-like metal-dependent hydrolase (beta-lactamase superfamily II)
MKEVLPGIHQWSWLSPEKGIDFNGLYVNAGGEALLIDPPPFGERDEVEIRRLGEPATILVTNRHHGRRAAECRDLFLAKVLLPAADASFATFPSDGTFAPGDQLPCGFTAVGVPDSKSPGETALYHAGMKTLVLGDALIGRPPGMLTFLPWSMFADVAKAREGVRSLLALDFDAVLVGDGASILSGGKSAVRRALES